VTTFLHRHRRALVPLVLAVAATIVALVYRTELAAWVRGAGARSAGVEPHAGAVASGALDPGSDGVAYYTCPMHTSVRAEGPGACPICSMPLVAVTAREVSSGVVTILADRREAFGILTTPATVAPLRRSIRAVGRVTYDETRLTDVTLKLKGWIAQLDANATGQHVRRGQRLLSLYSPELYAAQQEYLAALGSPALEGLVGAARRKLELWGMTGQQISDVGKRGKPLENVPILAPASGYVIEKNVVEGAAVEAGQRLFRIAALDEVWVEAEVYEGDLPMVTSGQLATITLSYLPGAAIVGKVAYVYPYLDPTNRTARVRIALPNKDLALKPDMYATVELSADLGPRLQIPVSAVVYTGTRRIAFVDIGEGRLQPVEVELGVRNAEMVEVVRGLTAGQPVVVDGNFLVAAESRIRSADFWSGHVHP
jgi:Cu(I)/Ag(I) efflux system membrane fusion protein